MDTAKLEALRASTASEVKEQLGDLETADLKSLLEAETGDSKPRSSVVKAIEAELEERADNEPKKPAAAPEWQKPDYMGPLTGDQAEWRNKHCPTWRQPTTKPVKPDATK